MVRLILGNPQVGRPSSFGSVSAEGSKAICWISQFGDLYLPVIVTAIGRVSVRGVVLVKTHLDKVASPTILPWALLIRQPRISSVRLGPGL